MNKQNCAWERLFFTLLFVNFCLTISAKEYHVAKSGNDQNRGTLELPYLTIQAAANTAQAGDIVTVHEGVYREWDNTSANSSEGYVKTIERALENSWSKENIGSHNVRNNTISDCGQTGICGSMGGIEEDESTMSGLGVYSKIEEPMYVNGNIYLNGARAYQDEKNQLVAAYDPALRMENEGEDVYLVMDFDKTIYRMKNRLVDTDLLGPCRILELPYVNPDGSDIRIDTDYFGIMRNRRNPTAGPFEKPGSGTIKLKVRGQDQIPDKSKKWMK